MSSANSWIACSFRKTWILLLCLLFNNAGYATQIWQIPDTIISNSSVQATRQQPESGPEASKIKLSPVAKGAAWVVVGGGLWTATFAWVDEPLQQLSQNNRNTVGDKIAHVVEPFGRQGVIMPLTGATFAAGVLLKDSKLQKAGMVSLGSVLISAGITSTLKNQFHRYRPSGTNENHIFSNDINASYNNSLPSSHTATAFAVATSFATVYGHDNRFVKPFAYSMATLVGLSRVNDNAHWATDVMAGALVGFISSKGATMLYEFTEQKLRIRRQRLYIVPQPGIRNGGVAAMLVF